MAKQTCFIVQGGKLPQSVALTGLLTETNMPWRIPCSSSQYQRGEGNTPLRSASSSILRPRSQHLLLLSDSQVPTPTRPSPRTERPGPETSQVTPTSAWRTFRSQYFSSVGSWQTSEERLGLAHPFSSIYCFTTFSAQQPSESDLEPQTAKLFYEKKFMKKMN